jgi:hypothetical protein
MASYTETTKMSVSDVPYMIEDLNGNRATLIIDGVPDYKILPVELLPDNVMLITFSFATGYDLKDIEVFWKMYYRKVTE